MGEGTGDESAEGGEPDAPKRVQIDYIKSNFFRVMMAEGFIVGPTPGGMIHIEAYSVRAAIPKTVIHEVSPDGNLGPEVKEERQGKKGIIREVEGQIVMRVEVARDLVRVLTPFIDQLEKDMKDAREAAIKRDIDAKPTTTTH
jgi:hypothetical protein